MSSLLLREYVKLKAMKKYNVRKYYLSEIFQNRHEIKI